MPIGRLLVYELVLGLLQPLYGGGALREALHPHIQRDRYMRWRFATGPELSPEASSVARRHPPSAFVRELQGSRLERGLWAVLASLAGDAEGLKLARSPVAPSEPCLVT
jgi:hypothetical protein